MKRLVVMGGGVWVPRLAERLAAAWRGEAMTLTLVAQQADRLAIIARHTRARLARWQAEWRVEHTPNVHAALEGAEAVVLLVRVGGWRARAHDETFRRRGAWPVTRAWVRAASPMPIARFRGSTP